MEACKMLSTSIVVTDYCTLNCKLCLAYIPYLRDRKRLSLAEAKIVFYNFNQHKLITYLINNKKINLNNKCKPMYGAF